MIHLHFDRLYTTCLIFGERFCPTFSIIPINSSKKMPLPLFKGCFDVSVDVRGGRNSLQCRRILAGRNLVCVLDIGSFCRYRKALFFWSLGISLYLELFCFLSFITIVLRNLCSGTHRKNRDIVVAAIFDFMTVEDWGE